MDSWHQAFGGEAEANTGLRIFGPYDDFPRLRQKLVAHDGTRCIEVELTPQGRLRRFVYLPRKPDSPADALAVVMVAGPPHKPFANPSFYVASNHGNPLEGQGYTAWQLLGPTASEPILTGLIDPDRSGEIAAMILKESQVGHAALTDQRGGTGKRRKVVRKQRAPAQAHRTLQISQASFLAAMKELDMYHSFGADTSQSARDSGADTWQNQSGRYAEGVTTFYRGMVWTYRRCPQELSDSDATPWIVEGLLRHGATPLPNDVYNLSSLRPSFVGQQASDLDQLLERFGALQIP